MDQVEDRTGGGQIAGLGGRGGFVPSISESLREALEVEFGRLGIPLVASRAKADAALSVAVTMASTRGTPQGLTADLASILTVKGSRGENLWENTLLGSGISQGYNVSPWGPAFTAALADLMSKIGPVFQSQDVVSKILAASSVSAGDAVGRKARAEPPVVRSDVDELPSIKAKPNKNSYAIVIGIEQYRQKLPKADFAVADAKTMTEYLTKVMGYPEENVVTLTNEHAAKSDFEKYFEKCLPNNVEKDGSVFIYYSGHGAPNVKTGDAFLVPYDGDPSFIAETGYSLKRLYEALGKLPAKEIIVALDSCFSGAGGKSVIAKGARPLVMTMESLAIPSKVGVLSASSGDQISSTYEEKGHGLFTYFMLKGLKGDGDVNGDGKVELGELFNYIKPQVERIARKTYNNEQSPQLIAPNELMKQKLMEK
ncbi:MAG: caspase family protein [Deltaproteobacteria bacterium]|nr:caspase family protein [Deltaproteobacteria bacterium]